MGGPGELRLMPVCRTCRRPIVWATTARGGRMPVDPEPSPAGNVRLDRLMAMRDPVAAVLHGDELEQARERGVVLHRAHFATCPDAETHRHRRAKAARP